MLEIVRSFERGIRDLDLFGHQSSQQRGPPQEGFESNRSEPAVSSEFIEQTFGAIGILREGRGEQIPLTLEIIGSL